jgi:prevent-host-death family protein
VLPEGREVNRRCAAGEQGVYDRLFLGRGTGEIIEEDRVPVLPAADLERRYEHHCFFMRQGEPSLVVRTYVLTLDNRSEFDIIKRPEVIEMNMSKDIRPITYLKSRAADLLKQINETHRPVIITQNGEPKAVLQDPESYENMRNALGMLKLISLAEEEIKNGNVKTQGEVFDRLDKMLQGNEQKI